MSPRHLLEPVVCAGLLLLQAACVGHIGPGDDRPAATTPSATDAQVSSSAVRRLSTHELDNTLEAVVGMVPEALALLPPEGLGHSFARVVNAQTMSPAHLEAYSAIAAEVAVALVSARTLDDLVTGCPDSSIPSLVSSTTSSIDGNGLTLSPDWALSTPSNPAYGSTVYAPDPEAQYNHAFPMAGSYQLSAALDIVGPVHTLDVLVDGELAASQQDLDGAQTVTATLSIDTAGSHVITLALGTEPDDNQLQVVFESLTIAGPMDSSPDPSDSAVKACATSVIDELAQAAYRRPLSDAERQRLAALYDELVTSHGPADALTSLLEAIFSSPHFLFLVEIGDAVPEREGLYRLRPWEIASRLSYAICEQPPDAELRAAAANDALATAAQVEAEARRLFAKPCAKVTVERFFEYWLWLNRLPSLNKSADAYPSFTEAVRAGMVAESKRFLSELVWKQDAPIASLFDADYAWPDPDTAAIYGLPSVDGEQTKMPAERAGILTSAGVLAVTASFDDTSPVRRGVYVLEQILCAGTPPPPSDLEIAPPLPDPDLTTRERWEAHSNDPVCASCHQLIDPIGFTLEEFDAIGQHRTTENGLPVDASGGVPTLGVDNGSIVGGAALAKVLAESTIVKSCVATQWLRFAAGRLETEADTETIATVATAFDQSTIRDALVSIVTTDTFLHRIEGKQ